MKIRPRLRKKSRNPAWCEQKIARHVIMQIKVDLICVSLALAQADGGCAHDQQRGQNHMPARRLVAQAQQEQS